VAPQDAYELYLAVRSSARELGGVGSAAVKLAETVAVIRKQQKSAPNRTPDIKMSD
jgi:hypothetical protein